MTSEQGGFTLLQAIADSNEKRKRENNAEAKRKVLWAWVGNIFHLSY